MSTGTRNALKKMGIAPVAGRIYAEIKMIWEQGAYWLKGKAGRLADDGLPVPPPRMRRLVAGEDDLEWFLKGGQLAAETIREALERNEIGMNQFEKMLDFGCGCGRVTRQWKDLHGVKVHGTDYNQRLIKWCCHNLRFARFVTNQLEPPLSYSDQSFDFIYALSVFTHIPEALQFSWMDELRRVMKSQGLLLITTHGKRYLNVMTQEERNRFQQGQLVVQKEQVAGTNMCVTYHPPSYVYEKLARNYEAVDFIKEGAKGNPHQDIFLLRKV